MTTPPLTHLLEDLRLAAISRALDDKEIALQKQNRAFFQISGAGHEALCLGLARSLRAGHDWFFPYYRDRSLVLGLGVSPLAVLLQAVGAAEDPASGGRQMPCHFGDPARHVVSQTSATGSQILPAVGCAEAGRYLLAHPGIGARATASADEVTYVSLGEGATSQGEFWEGLNTAATARLPLLIVVADNGWAISVPAAQQQPAPISELLSGFDGLHVEQVDGTDYAATYEIGRKIVASLRAGDGPVLLHATVTRPYSHSAADTQSKYRTESDLDDEQARDPIRRMARLAVEAGLLSESGVEELLSEARAEVDAAAVVALAAAPPDPTTATRHVVSLPRWPVLRDGSQRDDGGEELNMADAIRRCLHEIMAADERVRVFGEDVADAPAANLDQVEGKGGVFGTTFGLQRSFGEDRCFNSPLAEANIVGRAVGQAVRGLRPCPEVQFFDYIWTAMQQIRTEAATLRWRSNGAFSAPMVLRVPIGGYLSGGAIWHSQSGEAIFTHTPGLLVAMPSTAADAVGLLRAAFLCEDPVLFLEHKHLYRQPTSRSPYPEEGWILPFGRGALRRRGDELTIVSWGATVGRCLDAAAGIEAENGTSCDVIDLRTLVPWDRQMVADSVASTGRLLVVHEDVRSGGFGAEVAAWVADECFHLLRAPIRRVAALDTFVGYSPALEEIILPQTADIADAIAELTAR
ncbi:MAG: dehydrogenase E1 component subunit alpha/beta [Microthrixaceae bacterium]|nr:dehydrogenase E1 component subunit alpha/beta [Microthrixaceae bacterium]